MVSFPTFWIRQQYLNVAVPTKYRLSYKLTEFLFKLLDGIGPVDRFGRLFVIGKEIILA